MTNVKGVKCKKLFYFGIFQIKSYNISGVIIETISGFVFSEAQEIPAYLVSIFFDFFNCGFNSDAYPFYAVWRG
jgi:hypothetical protein